MLQRTPSPPRPQAPKWVLRASAHSGAEGRSPRLPSSPLTPPPRRRSAARPDSRAAAMGRFDLPVEESPGSTGTRCRLTAGGGDPRDSATENKPPVQGAKGNQGAPRARAKRCGKSAPRPWQQGRQGKPHREQARIGTAAMPQGDRRDIPVLSSGLGARGASRGASQRNGRHAPQGADRTRLTGCLATIRLNARAFYQRHSPDTVTLRIHHKARIQERSRTRLSTGTKSEYFGATGFFYRNSRHNR